MTFSSYKEGGIFSQNINNFMLIPMTFKPLNIAKQSKKLKANYTKINDMNCLSSINIPPA
jgi:hypothetical protein